MSRIGEILVQRGKLHPNQVDDILKVQKNKELPFGVLAERMFEVTNESVEDAWVEQYVRYSGEVNLNTQNFDQRALAMISRRQAWQFELLPIGWDANGDLVLAASRERLARAVTFAISSIEPPICIRIADTTQLRQYLRNFYPMPEMPKGMLQRARDMAHEG